MKIKMMRRRKYSTNVYHVLGMMEFLRRLPLFEFIRTRKNFSDMDRKDSVILTFHVPPLARGYALPGRGYVISIVYSPKISKNWNVLAPQN